MTKGERPIFVVGAPRSGTSLLRVTLNRHPAIEVCDETHFFYKLWIRRRAFGDLAVPENRRRVVSRFVETRAIKALGLDRDMLAQALMREGTSYDALFAALMREAARQRGKARFGEKTPRHALFSNTLCDWFPECALIHIVRDPRDVAASLKRVPFGSRQALVNTRMWLAHVRGAHEACARPNYLLVKYEAFVREPETELRRILSFVGEDFAPSLLEAPQAQTGEVAWWFKRALGPVEPSRVGVWRAQLDGEEVSLVEWAAAAEMAKFDYAPEAEAPSPAQKAAALARAGLRQAVTRAANLPTLWHYWVRRSDLAGEEAAWAKREAPPRGSVGEALRSLLKRAQTLLAGSTAGRYAIAAACAAFMLALRAAFDPVLGPGAVYFVYYPGILLLAYWLGLGPGLLTMGVAGLGAYFAFNDPPWTPQQELTPNLRLLLFLATSSILAYGAAHVGARLRALQRTVLGDLSPPRGGVA